VEEGIQKKGVREDASVKGLGSCHRAKGRVHTRKRKGVFIIEGRKERSTSICGGSVEERIHPTFQVTTNITSTLCGKKEWHSENGTKLLTYKSVDNKEWVSLTPHRRHTGWSGKEEGVYKARSEVGIQ